ncbi:cadherin-like beta sandwich domain-containing protein [Paenibacillus albidus]|uniref:invasin domain 3-containing protein n=1 Tax=Paenibacillus albidus TaxID=2041023 RepID=UPI001BE71A0A|nr:invasin domain 3-containing protein [Paenibacillus albidus]MBT2290968.1 cadherin-like beta sandwich domain-containing protein [Paenibacillus albidus]
MKAGRILHRLFPYIGRKFMYGIAALVLVMCLFMVTALAAAAAETITVNTMADTEDVLPGDGICADSSGNCSLRAAVQTANAGSTDYEIKVPAGTYTLTSGDPLELRNHMVLTGDGGSDGSAAELTVIQAAAAPGNANFRVFNLNPDAEEAGYDITLQNMTVRGGGVNAPGDFGGAGILGYTGQKTITLQNLIIKDNAVGDGLYGGGLNIAGPPTGALVLHDTVIENNTAGNTSGSYTARAGGAYLEGDLKISISNTKFIGNTVYGSGGGMQAYPQTAAPGTVVITGSLFTGNQALGAVQEEGSEGRGGGVFMQRAALIQSTVFEKNYADGDGGGLAGDVYSGLLTLSEVTIAGNGAYGRGGGIYMNDTAKLSLSQSTVQDNVNSNDQSPSDIEVSSDVADVVVQPESSMPSLIVAGQQGLSYDMSVRNTGKTATAKDLKVQFTLDSKMTPVSLSGTDWSCVVATLSCTTTKSIAANGTSSAIQLVVDAEADAGNEVSVKADVVMEEEANTLNNSRTDLIPVVSPVTSTLKAEDARLVADGSNTTTVQLQMNNAAGTAVNDDGNAVLPVLTITGGGTLGPVATLGGGAYQAALTAPTTIGTSTIEASLNGVQLQEQAEVEFVAAGADAAKSSVAVDQATLTADGMSTAEVTVTVRDAQGNPLNIGGDTVVVAVSGGGSVGTVADHGDGTYGATLTAPTAVGTATITAKVNGAAVPGTATVSYVAGAADAAKSSVAVDQATLTADGASTAEVTVTVRDAQGNPLLVGGDTVAVAVSDGSVGTVADHGDGTYGATLTAPTSTGTATITAQVNGAAVPGTATVSYVAGTADAAKSSVAVDQATLTADGVSTAEVTVTVRDAQGNPLNIGGDTVVVAVSGGGSVGTVADHGDGTYGATLTAPTSMGTATITAKVNGAAVPGTATVSFVAGTADAAKSSVAVDQATLTADGVSTAEVTVTVRDAQGNPLLVGGDTVTVTVSGGGSVGAVADHGDGTYGATLTAPTSTGTATITAQVNGAAVPGTATVSYVAGTADAAKSSVAVDPASLTADGVSTAEVTVTVRDAQGNALLVGGDTVAIAVSGGSVGTVADHGDGTYGATLTAPTSTGTATITAKVNGAPVPGTATVSFVAGAADTSTSTLRVDRTELPADGSSTAQVTVTLKDSNGNVLGGGGQAVSLEIIGVGTLSAVTDLGDGTYRAVLTAPTAAGIAQISAEVGGMRLAAEASVNFIADQNANARALFVNGAPLNDFDPQIEKYVYNVPYSTDQATVTVQTYSPYAAVTVTGATYLEIGPNDLQVIVTAQDRAVSKTYHLTIVRAEQDLSSDARAVRLVVNGSALPDFEPDVRDYTLNVAHETTSALVEVQTAEADASVSVSGGEKLLVGSNTLKIIITAPDGVTTRTYTLHIVRKDKEAEASANADLAALAVDGVPLAGFHPDTTYYKLSVPYETTRVTVTAEVYEAGATADIWGGDILTVGSNLAAVTVMAPDGVATKRYELEIYRAEPPVVEPPVVEPPPGSPPVEAAPRSSNSFLTGLTLSAGMLKPGFSPGTTAYEVTVGPEVSALQITAQAEDPKAKLKIMYPAAGQVTEGMLSSAENSLSGNIPLIAGENSIKLLVIAEDGSWRTYSLRVFREQATGQSPGPEAPSGCAAQHVIFNDISGHWAEEEMKQAGCRGLVQGYPDGGVHPNTPVTRAEFIMLLASALNWNADITSTNVLSVFKDRESIRPWAQAAISQAVEQGIATGYEDGKFRPGSSISRAEMAVLMMRALGVKPEAGATTSFADDGGIPAWAKAYVAEAAGKGLINGRSGNRFDPSSQASRAEAIVLLLRLSNLLADES